MSQTRFHWVDTAKAVSILLVVILHTRNQLQLFSIESEALNSFVELTTTLRMPLFFAMAGLFAGKWLRSTWRELFTRKFSLLVWVFIVWQPIVLLYKLLNHWILGTMSARIASEEAIRALIAPLRPNGELWFLWTLVVFFLIGKVTMNANVQVHLLAATLIAFTWMTFIEPNLSESIFRALGSGWHGIFRYYFLFLSFALFSNHIINFLSNVKWYLSAAICVVWLAISITLLNFEIQANIVLFLQTIFGVLGGLGFARLVSGFRLFQFIGRNTLQIYVSHTPLIAVLVCGAVFSGLGPLLHLSVIFSSLVIVCIVIPCALSVSRLSAIKYMYQQPSWFRLGRLVRS